MPEPTLTFVIPTYNRAEKVKTCLTSIAAQIATLPGYAEIFVSDHGSTDHTAIAIEEVQAAYPAVPITYAVLSREGVTRPGFEHNYKFVCNASTTPWTWTMGDDDVLMPGMLKAILDLILQAEPEDVRFIKVAEKQRASEKPNIYRRLMIELCNEWGWLEMTGFISANIVRTDMLKASVNLPQWDAYCANAFPQSCGLLEVLAPHRALFVDIAGVDSQSYSFTEQTMKEWERQRTAYRYFLVDDALRDMVARKAIPPHYDPSFFRYHTYHLWDRFICNMISQYSNHPDDPQSELWPHVEGLAEFLHEEDAKTLRERCTYVQEVIGAHLEALDLVGERSVLLRAIVEQQSVSKFAWTYTGELHNFEYNPDLPPPGINGIAQVMWYSQVRQRNVDLEWLRSVSPELAGQLEVRGMADFPELRPASQLENQVADENPNKESGDHENLN